MPLDENEKEALKERYKEHRQSIWFGKHSLKLKRKKNKPNADSFPRYDEAEMKTKISPEQPTKSVETVTSNKTSRQRGLPIVDYEGQNQVVMLRRAKGKKSVSESPTKLTPSVSEPTRTTKTRKTKLSVAELPTQLEVNPEQPPLERMLKEKIRSQRQEIWTGASSQKKRRTKLKKQNSKKSAEDLNLISEQNSQNAKQGLTLGVVFIGIIAVVAAIVLGVLLGYLLA